MIIVNCQDLLAPDVGRSSFRAPELVKSCVYCVFCFLSLSIQTRERERERDSEADDNAIENKIHIRRFVELRIQQLGFTLNHIKIVH